MYVFIYIYVNFGWEQNCIVCKYSKTIVPTGIRRHNQTMLSNIRRLWISSFLIMAGMLIWTWHTSNWALKDLYSYQISFSFYHSCFVLAPNSFNIRNTWHFPPPESYDIFKQINKWTYMIVIKTIIELHALDKEVLFSKQPCPTL